MSYLKTLKRGWVDFICLKRFSSIFKRSVAINFYMRFCRNVKYIMYQLNFYVVYFNPLSIDKFIRAHSKSAERIDVCSLNGRGINEQ